MYITIPDWIWPVVYLVGIAGGVMMLWDLLREIINTFRR